MNDWTNHPSIFVVATLRILRTLWIIIIIITIIVILNDKLCLDKICSAILPLYYSGDSYGKMTSFFFINLIQGFEKYVKIFIWKSSSSNFKYYESTEDRIITCGDVGVISFSNISDNAKGKLNKSWK